VAGTAFGIGSPSFNPGQQSGQWGASPFGSQIGASSSGPQALPLQSLQIVAQQLQQLEYLQQQQIQQLQQVVQVVSYQLHQLQQLVQVVPQQIQQLQQLVQQSPYQQQGQPSPYQLQGQQSPFSSGIPGLGIPHSGSTAGWFGSQAFSPQPGQVM